MLRSIDKAVGVCALLSIALICTGCEQIESVKNYFQGADQKEAAVATHQAPAQAKAPAMQGNTLAVVGNWSITLDEFNDRLAALKEIVPEYDTNDPEAKQLVLDELVNQQILVSGAEQSGLANQKDIAAAVDEFRRTLIVREVARTLTENISVTDEEAQAFYNENKAELVGAAQWKVREIVVPTKEEANNLLTQLISGADFASIARQSSKGKTAANGGDLGYITEEPFAQMGNALLALEVGDTSGVFKGPEGHYIVKLEDKKEGAPIAYEDIKEDIIQSQTLLKQQEAILNHLNRLKAKIKIEVNQNLL